jgi:Ca-activated chloride channel family protein
VVISIEYQAPVRQLGGEYSMRLPLVVGPRYVPPRITLTSTDAGLPMPTPAVVTAPLAGPELGRSLNPVSITVHLAPGFEPHRIVSPYHRIDIDKAGRDERTVTLAKGEVPADRDFELRWRSASHSPTLGLFRRRWRRAAMSWRRSRRRPRSRKPQVAPREMIFVIDNSGSMTGESMAAAKRSLLHALSTLREQDSFNVIRFDDTMTQLFEHASPASREQVALARTFTEQLEASGGTEMLPALKAALVDDTPPPPPCGRSCSSPMATFLTKRR